MPGDIGGLQVPVEATVMITNYLTAAKHPWSTWRIWQSCWSVSVLGLRSLQSLHNREEISMPPHARVEHHLCCKEFVTPLLLGSFITVEIVFLL